MSFTLLNPSPGTLADTLSLAESFLQDLSLDSARFYSIFNQSFGNAFDATATEAIRLQWVSGDFSQLPAVTVLGSGMEGILGAYSGSTNQIYLSQTLIDSGDRETLAAVLLEEIGHFIDAHINSGDTPGDEGQLFSALVRGESLTAAEIAAIQGENDAGTILVEGQAVNVEMVAFSPTNFTVGNKPRGVTVGDFNCDGKLDLAVTNRSAQNVSILLGDGNGGFGTAANFAVGFYPQSVKTGDFNGDGKLDLAVANSGGASSGSSGTFIAISGGEFSSF